MPNRDMHQASTLMLAGAAYAVAGKFTSSPSERALVVSGILTGAVITPDLDLAENFADEHSWILYGLLFKHRGISHWPVIGTLTRAVYLGLLVVPLFIAWGKWELIRSWILSIWFMVWLAGLVAADVLHWLMDISSTKIKRWLREKDEKSK